MTEVILKPELYHFDSCAEFVAQFALGEGDLILTNRYIYEPAFGGLGLQVNTLFQEDYGTGEPTDEMVDQILAALDVPPRRLIAIGGGTVIDIAKVIAVADGGGVDSLYEKAPALTRRCELILIPTTCGTGSEVTNIAILNRLRMGTKMGLVSPQMYADAAVLIPQLLEALPFSVFATSSIDALVHAVESALSPKATPYTKLFSYRAIELLLRGYQEIASNGPDARLPLLDDFLIASNYAGIAFGTAGTAAVHAMSYPLGGSYHVPHGESNYALFTGVLNAYHRLDCSGELVVLETFLSRLLGCPMDGVYSALDVLLNHILPKKPLHAYGVTQADLPVFVDTVLTAQGRLTANNFTHLDREALLQIYGSLF